MTDFSRPVPSVGAVVVTYNRPDDLRASVSALMAQTYPLTSILVFDNAGPTPASQLLASNPRLKIVRSEVNLGGAGGFAAGLEAALEQDLDWVWLLDDDAIAYPDALEKLLSAGVHVEGSGVLLSSVYEFSQIAVRHRRKFEPWTGLEWSVPKSAYSKPIVRVDTGSFVGFLVPAKLARSIPSPNAEYFLAFDDTEYSLRIGGLGASLWLVPHSKINHLRAADSRLRQGPFGWKHFLNVRNHMFVKMRYSRIKPLAFVFAALYGILIWLRADGLSHLKTFQWLFKALGDGFSGRLGPPDQRLRP